MRTWQAVLGGYVYSDDFPQELVFAAAMALNVLDAECQGTKSRLLNAAGDGDLEVRYGRLLEAVAGLLGDDTYPQEEARALHALLARAKDFPQPDLRQYIMLTFFGPDAGA